MALVKVLQESIIDTVVIEVNENDSLLGVVFVQIGDCQFLWYSNLERLRGSSLEDDEVVGFGRTVDDGRYYGLIVDLVVSPRFQGRGIGSRLLAELRDCLAKYEFCTLTAAPGKDGFYLCQGWKRQSSSFIWPKDPQQESQHSQ